MAHTKPQQQRRQSFPSPCPRPSSLVHLHTRLEHQPLPGSSDYPLPRTATSSSTGQCRYAIFCDEAKDQKILARLKQGKQLSSMPQWLRIECFFSHLESSRLAPFQIFAAWLLPATHPSSFIWNEKHVLLHSIDLQTERVKKGFTDMDLSNFIPRGNAIIMSLVRVFF